jgi:hypothetical protein
LSITHDVMDLGGSMTYQLVVAFSKDCVLKGYD